MKTGLDLWRIDWIFLCAALAIIGLGLPFMHSAATEVDFQRQLVWIAVGLTALIAFAMIDYRFWIAWAYWFYALSVTLLVFVLFTPAVNNSNRFFRLGPIGMQPSELFKLAIIIALAHHLGKRDNQDTVPGLVIPFLITLLPLGLIMRQPDLGTAMIIPPILLAMLLVSGARPLHICTTIAAGTISAVPMWLWIMKPYQKARVLAFLDPERFESAEAYQMLMSLAAIGSGGISGQGLGNGVITDLDLLPEKHNDFIFGVVAEEGGLAASGSLLLLFLIITLSGFYIAGRIRDPAGRLLATGISSILGLQSLLNIGIVTGMLPTTGMTLPMVSYGGSSMIVSCAMLGLLINVGQAKPDISYRESLVDVPRI